MSSLISGVLLISFALPGYRMLADDTRLPKVEFDPILIPCICKAGDYLTDDCLLGMHQSRAEFQITREIDVKESIYRSAFEAHAGKNMRRHT